MDQASRVNSVDTKCRECRVSIGVERAEEIRTLDSGAGMEAELVRRPIVQWRARLDSSWTPKQGIGKVCWL
jgi:hypothetical protein